MSTSHRGPPPSSRLYDAVGHNDIHCVKRLLLDHTVDVNARAGSRMEPPLHMAVLKNSIEILTLLLNAHAEVNETDFYGFTALHKATTCGHYEIVKTLINYGADVYARSLDGTSCQYILDRVRNSNSGHTDIRRYFDQVNRPQLPFLGKSTEALRYARPNSDDSSHMYEALRARSAKHRQGVENKAATHLEQSEASVLSAIQNVSNSAKEVSDNQSRQQRAQCRKDAEFARKLMEEDVYDERGGDGHRTRSHTRRGVVSDPELELAIRNSVASHEEETKLENIMAQTRKKSSPSDTNSDDVDEQLRYRNYVASMETLEKNLLTKSLKVHRISGDGNCQFAAVAHQIKYWGSKRPGTVFGGENSSKITAAWLRIHAAEWLFNHETFTMANGSMQTFTDTMLVGQDRDDRDWHGNWSRWCHAMGDIHRRPPVYGGAQTLQALAEVIKTRIRVWNGDPGLGNAPFRKIKFYNPKDSDGNRKYNFPTIDITHIGVHYDSTSHAVEASDNEDDFSDIMFDIEKVDKDGIATTDERQSKRAANHSGV
jgi:hypothetical protein